MKIFLLTMIMYLGILNVWAQTVEIDGICYMLYDYEDVREANVEPTPNKYSGSVKIPTTITYEGVLYNVVGIRSWAFKDCTDLISIEIPSSVKYIGEKVFDGCSNLSAVYITDLASWCNITFAGLRVDWDNTLYTSNPLYFARHLFLNGEEVVKLIIPSGVESISSQAFIGCEGLVSIEFPNGLTTIGDYAFAGCSDLQSIEIPNSITSIGYSAFANCNISKVTCLASRPPTIATNTFANETYNNGTLFIPEGSENAFYVAEGWKKFKTIETIKEQKPSTIPQDVDRDGVVDTQDVLDIYKYIQEH